jgi:hypothetical protein
MPELKGHIVPEISWLTLASKVYKEYGDISLNVYTDEDWVTKTLIQYNGVEGPHGIYKFKHIDQRLTPRLSSATALRAAVQANDRDAFTKAAGVDANTPVGGKPFFDVVAHYLAPYAAKLAAPKIKKKQPAVAEGIFGLSSKEKAKIQYVTAKISDIPGNWDHKNQQYTERGLADLKSVMKNEKYLKYALSLTSDDFEAEGVAEGAPIVVMPRADRLKKPEPTKVRYQGDIVPPSKLPSTEKRGVKGRPGQRPMPDHNLKDSLSELSNELLGRYKKAAGADASKADKAGDFKRGDKRFSGINKATIKQFDNDSKDKK